MKGILMNLISVLFLAAGAGKLAGATLAPAVPMEPSAALELAGEPAAGLAEISGTWHSFPAGIVIGISQAGDIQFGLDSDGEGIGLKANAWFSGKELHLVFGSYDGAGRQCRGSEGVYEVFWLPGGALRFVAVADECQFRQSILSGDGTGDNGPLFHPVN